MIDKIVNGFISSPINFSIAFFIILLGLALFFKIIGNPFNALSNLLKTLLPLLIKELKFEAGKAGIIDITIIFCLTLLSVIIFLKPDFLSIFSVSSSNSIIVPIILIFLDVITFIISLKLVADLERTIRLFKSEK